MKVGAIDYLQRASLSVVKRVFKKGIKHADERKWQQYLMGTVFSMATR